MLHPSAGSAPATPLAGTPLLESHYAAIVESSMDAIRAETVDGVITSWNRAAERVYGHGAEDILGASSAILLPPDRREEHEQIVARVLEGDRIEHYETARLHRDGRVLDVSLTVSPIRDPEGQVMGLSVISRDITDRKGVERDLARTRAQLVAHAAELERSNADLEQFVYAASHDLSEPLRSISGFLQLLENRYGAELDEDGRRYVRRSVEGAERMRTLLDALLTYARTGRERTPMEPVALDEVVAQALEALDATVRETGAKVVVNPLPTVPGNASQLVQLFQNLLSNALKFTRPGAPPDITVTATADADGWRVSVLDDGIGFDERYADRVFLVFKRLHKRSAYPGTGIGLAICRRIAEVHDGRIWCESRPEGGSAFHLSLPVSPEILR